MAINQDQKQSFKSALDKANDVYILLPQYPSTDALGAALSLFETLKTTNKNVYIASPKDIEGNQPLPGLDQITHKIGNRNLVISLHVESRDSIDKVSYNLEEDGKVFNLIIQPKKGRSPLRTEDVDFSYAGAQADLVILVGANRFEDFGEFYQDEPKLFQDSTTVALNRATTNNYAQITLDDPQASSVAEVTYKLIQFLEISFSKEASTDLLYAIDQTTNNLMSPNVTPDTFEAVATLMRQGGVRQPAAPQAQALPNTPSSQPSTTPAQGVAPATTEKPQSGDVPQDWLAPKIYKSPSRN